jgi:hypothetical protein
MAQPNADCPHEDGIEYTDLSSDIDFVALFGQPVRAVEIVTATTGTLVVYTMKSGRLATPATRTFTALAAGSWLGGVRGLNVAKIVASGTTGITKIRVWL